MLAGRFMGARISLASFRRPVLAISGLTLISVGLLWLRRPSSDPVPWQWLQDTMSAVFPNPLSVLRGSILVVLGMYVFAPAVQGHLPERLLYPGRFLPLRFRPERGSLALLIVGAALYIATLELVSRGSTGFLAGGIFLAALVATSVALSRFMPRKRSLLTGREALALCAVTVAAFVLYAHDARSWYYAWVGDESEFYYIARGIAWGVPTNVFSQLGVYSTHPVMDSVYQAIPIKLLGANVFAWRASCALVTAVTVFPLYVLVKLSYSRLAAILSVGFYAGASVLLAYAHIGYNEPDALFPLVASAALLVAARIRNAPYYLFLAGLFAGVGWYTLSVARVAIGLVVLGVLLYRPNSVRNVIRDLLLVGAGFALVLLPFVIVNGQTIFAVMIDQSRWGDSGLPPLGIRLSQNGLRSIFAYIYYPSADNHYVVGALWDTVSAGCLLLGMSALLIRRTATGMFLLLCFWLQVAVNGPTYYDLHLNTTRMYVIAPFAAAIAGIGGSALLRLVGELVPDRARRRLVVAVGAAGLIVAALVLNLYNFYWTVPETIFATPQVMETELLLDHPHAVVIEQGEFLTTPYESMAQAYGVDRRVIVPTHPLQEAVHRARALHRLVIVISTDPFPPHELRGRHVTVWDPSHHVPIYAVYIP